MSRSVIRIPALKVQKSLNCCAVLPGMRCSQLLFDIGCNADVQMEAGISKEIKPRVGLTSGAVHEYAVLGTS